MMSLSSAPHITERTPQSRFVVVTLATSSGDIESRPLVSINHHTVGSSFNPSLSWARTQPPVLDRTVHNVEPAGIPQRNLFKWSRSLTSSVAQTGCRGSRQRVTCMKLNDNAVVQSNGRRASCSELYQDVLPFYHRFVEHAVDQLSSHMPLTPFPVKTKFQELVAKDGKAVTNSFAFRSEKVRQFRAAEINGGRSIQVLNLVVFPNPAYDFPIFCADLVTFAKNHLIVLDLNPLYDPDAHRNYREKYIRPLSPLWKKYHELLPWGGELTREAVQFFSPFVLWSKPIKEQSVDDTVFSAFKDYFSAWLDMVDKAEASDEVDEICRNQEAQHRYMLWRSTKDPGRNLLKRLYGETVCEEYMRDFLFADLETLGKKTFLDYFPQFRDQSGSIEKQRSMAGKDYRTRPWDEDGNRISP